MGGNAATRAAGAIGAAAQPPSIVTRLSAAAASSRSARPPLDVRWWGLGFVLPVVVFFAMFSVFPVFFGFYLSLTDYDLLSPPLFVGLDNFRNLVSDKLFLTALVNTLIFVVGATVPVWARLAGGGIVVRPGVPRPRYRQGDFLSAGAAALAVSSP